MNDTNPTAAVPTFQPQTEVQERPERVTIQFTVSGTLYDFLEGMLNGFLCGLISLPFIWLGLKSLEARGLL